MHVTESKVKLQKSLDKEHDAPPALVMARAFSKCGQMWQNSATLSTFYKASAFV